MRFRNPDKRFNIAGDKKYFNVIVDDMRENGGGLAPSDHWNWNLGEAASNNSTYTDELFEARYSHLDKMLDPWVGVTGMQTISAESVKKYEDFLRPIDCLGLLPSDILSYGQANRWRETDLGSVLDANLIKIFGLDSSREHLAICEVGGGYGRLAEVLLDNFETPMHYVMIDAVPGSLMYAYLYLKSQFPEKKIGSFYSGDVYDTSYDCYIVPSWRANLLPEGFFDACINVESMQEMQQQHVDFHLTLFDRLIRVGGLVYLSNARDYVFKGAWNLPASWETLYLSNTPRSWSADHPTHILRKNVGDYSLSRKAHESAYAQQVLAWNNARIVGEQLLHIQDRDRICGELQKKLDQTLAGVVRKWRLALIKRWKKTGS